MSDRNYCELLANILQQELGVISEGFFTGVAVVRPHIPEGYVDPLHRFVTAVDRDGRKYKITIEEFE